jgi:hypothetical protein
MSASAGGTPPSTSPRLRAVSVAASGAGPPGRGRKASTAPPSTGSVFSYATGGGSVSPRSGGWAASSPCSRHRGALLTALLLGIVALNFVVPASPAPGRLHAAALLAEQLLHQQAQPPLHRHTDTAADAFTAAGFPAHEAQPPAALDGAAAGESPASAAPNTQVNRLRAPAQAAQPPQQQTQDGIAAAAAATQTDTFTSSTDTSRDTDSDRHKQPLLPVPATSSNTRDSQGSDSNTDNKNGNDNEMYERASKTGTGTENESTTDRHSSTSSSTSLTSADAADNTQTLQGSTAAASAASPSPSARPDAIVTLVAGNNAARAAVALVQSLRDVRTRDSIRIVVMLQRGGVGSPECLNSKLPFWSSGCGSGGGGGGGGSTEGTSGATAAWCNALTIAAAIHLVLTSPVCARSNVEERAAPRADLMHGARHAARRDYQVSKRARAILTPRAPSQVCWLLPLQTERRPLRACINVFRLTRTRPLSATTAPCFPRAQPALPGGADAPERRLGGDGRDPAHRLHYPN